MPQKERSVAYVSRTDKEVLGERGRIRTCDPCLKSVNLRGFAATYNLWEPPKSLKKSSKMTVVGWTVGWRECTIPRANFMPL